MDLGKAFCCQPLAKKHLFVVNELQKAVSIFSSSVSSSSVELINDSLPYFISVAMKSCVSDSNEEPKEISINLL
jgi:hypothetical protein